MTQPPSAAQRAAAQAAATQRGTQGRQASGTSAGAAQRTATVKGWPLASYSDMLAASARHSRQAGCACRP